MGCAPAGCAVWPDVSRTCFQAILVRLHEKTLAAGDLSALKAPRGPSVLRLDLKHSHTWILNRPAPTKTNCRF
jgi:hypothetical protein